MGDILAYHVDLSALPSQETLASLAQYATKSQEARVGIKPQQINHFVVGGSGEKHVNAGLCESK